MNTGRGGKHHKYSENEFTQKSTNILMIKPADRTCVHAHVHVCARVSLQESDRVEVQMVQEVGVRRSSVRTLVLHQVALQHLLTGVSLLHHQHLSEEVNTPQLLWEQEESEGLLP